MKWLGVCLILTGCNGVGFDSTPVNPICTGAFGYNFPITPSAYVPAAPMPPSNATPFYVTDSFNFLACPGPYMHTPGGFNGGLIYHGGDIVVVYVMSASYSAQSPAQINTDLRMGLYDYRDLVPTNGVPAPGNVTLSPKMVGLLTYGFNTVDPVPAMVLNEISPEPATRDFTAEPLIFTITIPNTWTGEYRVGAVMQFNTNGSGMSQYQYDIEGYEIKQ